MVPLGMSSDEIETSGYSHPMVRLWSPSRVGFARGKKPEAIMVERQPLTLDAKTIALVSEVLEDAWDPSRRYRKPRCRRARWPYASSNPQLGANVTVSAYVMLR